MKKVLIADDSPVVTEMLQFMVEKLGHECLLAPDGLKAAEIAYREGPDLIISDIEMPKMNGFQLARLLKYDPLTREIPIIMLTSKESASAHYWGMDTGADRYILKTGSSTEIQQQVTELLEQTEGIVHQRSQTISEWDIVEKVNNLLDKRLLETRITNEINSIVFNVHSVKECVESLLTTYRKILDFAVGVFMTFRENQTQVFFELAEPVNQACFQEVQRFTFKTALSNHLKISEEIEMVVNGDYGELTGTVSPENFFYLPLKDKAQNIGFIGFYFRDRHKISDETRDLIGKTKEAVNLVVDNVHMYQKIRVISAIDPLTQIYNRRHFMEYFDTELSRCRRLNLQISVIMLDIDNFKMVNDTYNHLSGDLVLKNVSSVVKASIRKMDIPARYGGEEFIVLLPETGVEDACLVAERIRTNIESYAFYSYDKQKIDVTVSLGVAYTNEERLFSNPLEIIRIADNNLYKAKKNGKNRVCH